MTERENVNVDVVCTLDRDSEKADERREQAREELVPNYVGAEETERGYVVRFDGTDETLYAVAQFVAEEHKCCGFAEYGVSIEPPYDETRLRIEGPEGTDEVFEEFVERLENAGW